MTPHGAGPVTSESIELDEVTHVYRVGGRIWPGVSEVLNPINELDGIPRDLLAAAAEFGRHVHTAVDFWNRGVLDEAALDPVLAPYLAGWKKYLQESGAVVIVSEKKVRHRLHRYCGTLDSAVALLRRARRSNHIVDVKSGLVPRTVGPQTAAYREAWVSEQLGAADISTTRFCVQLRPDGDYRLHKLEASTDWSMFVSCLNIHRWRFPNVS